MTGTRRVALVVGATLLAIMVVALASRAGVDDGRARDVSGIGGVVGTVVQAGSVMFVILMSGLIAWLYLGGLGGKGDRKKTPIWGTIVALLVVIAFMSLAGPLKPSNETTARPLVRPPSEAFPSVTVAPNSGDTDVGRDGWAMGVAGALLVLLVAGGYALARRRHVVVAVPTADVAAPATPTERDAAVARAHACTDPRQAVLLAFAAAEVLLSVDAATRRPKASSAREWSRAVQLRPLDEIVRRYEIARFSHHDVSDDDRNAALAALDGLASVRA